MTGDCDRESDAAPHEASHFRWDLALLGAFLGAALCGVAYWPANAALRDAFDVPSFPPGGGAYWLCWLLPVVAVAGILGLLLLSRTLRSFAGGFIAGLVSVGAAMCAFGYSVDSMPFYM